MPGNTHAGGVDLLGLAYLAVIFAVMFAPVLIARFTSSSGESDSDSDDGRGGGSPPPPAPPGSPSGGIPLPDARQASLRLRDHGRLADRRRIAQRRPGRHPDRTPARILR